MSQVRVGRFYTAARRHPWVLGKVGDWKIPLGPYTPAQIAVAVGGGFLLVKTISWWSWMGPVPIAAWLLAVWAVRRPKIKGRAPMHAALGWLLLAIQPQGGRVGGRAARDRTARALLGGFTVEGALPAAASAAVPHPMVRPGPGRTSGFAPLRHPASLRPMSGVQQLLDRAVQGGGVR